MKPAPIRYVKDWRAVEHEDIEYFELDLRCGHSVDVAYVPDQNRIRCSPCRAEGKR
jgi:hypothetical protein